MSNTKIDELYNPSKQEEQKASKVEDIYTTAANNLKKQKTSALSQLNIAKNNAMRYADTTAQAQGYATQGARLDSVNQIDSLYQGQVGNVENAYAQQLGNIETQRVQDNQNNGLAQTSYDILYDKLANASANTTDNEIDSIKGLYYNNLTDAQKMQLDYDIERFKEGRDSFQSLAKQFENKTPVASVEDLKKATGQTLNQLLGKGSGIGKDRLEKLQEVLSNPDLANGDTFKIKENYFVYFNGQLYSTGKQDKVTYNIKNK